jgi:hypothetical protein
MNNDIFIIKFTSSVLLMVFSIVIGISCGVFDISLAIVSASILNLLCVLIPIVMCRNVLNIIPFIKEIINYNLLIHKVLLYFFYIFSFIHFIVHYTSNEINSKFLYNPSIYTGNMLLFFLGFLFPVLFWKKTREKWFFIILHHILFIGFFGVILSHGTFCFYKRNGVCKESSSWKWILFSIIVVLIELILRYFNKKQEIKYLKVYERENTYIISLNLLKNPELEKLLGQTVFINCPEISLLEWHPFTIVSTPYDIHYTTLFIKERGDWTSQLVNKCGKTSNGLIESMYPKIIIDGPYNCDFKNIKYNLVNKIVCFYMAGIGITGFIGFFKYIIYTKILLKKLIIVISIRNFTEIDILQELLLELSKTPEIIIQIHETDKTKQTLWASDSTCRNITVFHERPNLKKIQNDFKIEKFYQVGFN